MSARSTLDTFDDLLASAFRCLSHLPLLSGYDEAKITPLAICPIWTHKR